MNLYNKKMKKILCVYTVDSILCPKEKPLRYTSDIPLGISYIMSAVKHEGYDLDLFVFSQKNNIKQDIKNLFTNNDFDIVLFTSVSSQYFFVKKIAQYMKQIKPSIKNVIGGVHATLNTEDIIEESCFDAICVGDGEYAIVEYINCIRNNYEIKNINNLYIRINEKEFLKPKEIYFIQDLDKLQTPLRDIWNKWIYFPTAYHSSYKVLLTRGCYNKCSYCSNHALAKISKTKYVRYRNIDKVIEEINSINYNKIDLISESLTLNHQYFDNLVLALKINNENRKKKIEYFTDCNVYHSILNDDFFRKMKEANIKILGIGLESGSYKIRKNILNRPNYSNKDFYVFCELAKKYNIITYIYVLVGLPYEEQKDYLRTINVLRKTQPSFILEYIYMPYPNTDLYNRLIKDKVITNYDYFDCGAERIKAVVSYPEISKFKIQINYLLLTIRVYCGYKSIIELFVLTMGRILYAYNKLVPSFLYNFLEKRISKNLENLEYK